MNHITRRQMLSLTAGLAAGPVWLPRLFDVATHDNMDIITRPIPSTKEKIPVVGMGTWQTFDVGNDSAARDNLLSVLRVFAEKGGRVIDSSPMYGTSERVVGDLIARLDDPPDFFLATKVWTRGREAGSGQMRASMEQMRARPLDLMQVHNLVDFQTHIQTMRQWREEGRIRYLGATHYLDSAHDDLEQLIQQEPLDFIQINYAINDREADHRLLPLARDKGVAVIINRPYGGGDLFRRVRGRELPAWASDYDIASWGQFFLKFIISHPAVTCVIPATSKVHHMEDNMGAGYGRLPDEKGRQRMVAYLEG